MDEPHSATVTCGDGTSLTALPKPAPERRAREIHPATLGGPRCAGEGCRDLKGGGSSFLPGPSRHHLGPAGGGMLGIVGTLPARLWEPLSGKHCACASIQCAFIVLLLYAGHWGHALTEGTVPCATCQCEKSHRNINQPGAPRAVSHPRPRPAAAPTVQSCLPALTLCAVK